MAFMCQNTITRQSKTDESTPTNRKTLVKLSHSMKSLITCNDHH